MMDDDLEEVDVDKFFGIKEENFDQGVLMPNHELMQ